MKRLIAWTLALFALPALAPAAGWTDLLDKDLSQWRTYLAFRHDGSYHGAAPVDGAGRPIEPIGYDKDPTGVFTIAHDHDELVLRVSGEVYGCIFTKQEFANYRLRLKMKWGTAKWRAKSDRLKDSGLLYHSIGPCGVDYWRAWMLSQEFQIMEGHTGDYWNIGSSAIDIRAVPPEDAINAIANDRRPFLPFGSKPSVAGFCLRSENHESDPGEWTELELICFGDKSLHLVNGHVVMALRHSRSIAGGVATPLTKGKLQLQCEGCEIFFKDIRIRPIDALPAAYSELFPD